MVGSAVAPGTGNVGLIIDPDPAGRSGFMRLGPGTPPEERDGPFFNFNWDERMDERWWYQNED